MRGTVEAVGVKSLMPSNTLATLVALTPPGVGVEYLYCDENVGEIDWHADCDLVALTGYSSHRERLAEISRGWRARGVPVALGGPFATLMTAEARPLADHLFVGEGEHTWPRFLREYCADAGAGAGESAGAGGSARADAAARTPADLYEQTEYVDLADSPAPDWSFIDARDYLYLTVQTSRGCPNRCDFCDAIQLVGRKQRCKSIGQVLVEVDNAARAGAETIFFSEDNFGVRPAQTRELLERLVQWNTSQEHPVQFSCQTSIRITDSHETLKLMADARFAALFIGLESVRKACLEEVNKGQLYRADAAERIRRLSSYGLLPFLGLIVGFDHDDPQTFDELEQFLNDTGSPIASVSVLTAPDNTPLYHRMAEQGRIAEPFAACWHDATNIQPLQWTTAELLQRHQRLFRRLYDPARFEPRALKWLAGVTYHTTLYTHKRKLWTNLHKIFRILTHYLLRVEPPVRDQFFRILKKTWEIDPRLVRKAITIMTQYAHYYDFVHRS